MDEVRVLVVDDSAFVRRAVDRMLSEAPEITVVGVAANGAEAVTRVHELRPDVVILDVNMPHLDGIEALRRIMADAPTGVLMLSTHTSEGAEITITALEMGAVDFVDKADAAGPMDIYSLGPILREKVLAVAGATVARPAFREPPTPGEIEAGPPDIHGEMAYDIVVIGASTGGPGALTELVARLPGDLPLGFVIAQHMPPGFTTTFAERLDRRTRLEVEEAMNGDEVRPGRILVAPGGMRSVLARDGDENLRLRIDHGPPDLLHRPSVDALFESAADLVGDRAIGIVLTGMGDDGASGLARLKESGGATIVESEETAVIYGMPRAAAPAAGMILPLHEIPSAIVRLALGDRTDLEAAS